MIPIFHASGHLAYARSARRYVEAMFTLPEIMDPHQYHKLTAEGLFTVRRSSNSWSGNFTDQTIEQELMRLIKAPGGLAHGRGITPSTQTKLVHVLPKCIPVCRALENFCEVHTHTSDQHFDLRDSSSVRDSKDYETYLRWLESHCPFGFENVDGLVSISTGVVAAKNANADEAFTIGQVAADAISGTNYAEMKLRRKDRVVSISMSHNAGTVRGQQVELNPTLLFMRVTCVITDRAEMAKNLEFEFSKQPTALFDKGVMHKGVKSTLAHILQKNATVVTSAPSGSHFLIDGGYLLHLVLWPKDCTYAGVCNNYVEFVLKLFGQDTSVVFDGYTDTSINTKTCEQDRRASRTTSPDIIVGLDTDVTVKQAAFLNNRKNKAQFIHLLKDIFEQKYIACFQSDGDADYLICQTAMTKALTKQPVVLVGNDTDLLVILIHSVTKDLNISMQTSTKPNTVYSIAEIQSALSDDVKSIILLAHAIIGCDTVSALYNIGKQKVISVLQNTNDDFTVTVLNVFKERNASHHQIASAGEYLMLKLYGAKKQNLWTR